MSKSRYNNKDTYRRICETEGDNIPLFQQYWWMETVCEGKQWDALLTKDGDGKVVGALPYLTGQKCGLRYILMPQLTMYNGPWLAFGLTAEGRTRVLANLAAQLAAMHPALCLQKFHPSVTDWEPFRRHGFRQTTRYTYRFDPLPEPSALRGLADRGRRRGVEEVEKAYTVDRTVGADEFADLHTAYWERRSGHDLIDRSLIQRVCSTALGRNQALLYGLRDKEGTLMAARFVVFDSHCAYALMSAMRPEALRNSMSLLVWTMLAELYGRTEAFDFEGGMDAGVGHFYQSFGTTKTEFHCIYRSRIPFGKKLLHL